MDYLEINLQRCAIIKFSSNIWKRRDLKKYLLTHPHWRELKEWLPSASYMRRIIPPDLHKELDILNLPSLVKDEIKMAVGTMGRRIIIWLEEWRRRTIYENDDDIANIIDHIHWNHRGFIDLFETTKSLYKIGILGLNASTLYHLCNLCIEECIIDFWKRIVTSIEHRFFKIEIYGEDGHWADLFVYWRERMATEVENIQWHPEMVDYDYAKTMDYQMAERTLGSKDAFSYFWNRLSYPEKQSICHEFITTNSFIEKYPLSEGTNFDDLMFQLKLLSIHGFNKINMKNVLRSKMLYMSEWPYDKNFISVLPQFYENCEVAEREEIIKHLLYLMWRQRTHIGKETPRTRQWLYWFCDNHEMTGDIDDIVYEMTIHEDAISLRYIVTHAKSENYKERIMSSLTECIVYANVDLNEFIDEFAANDIRKLMSEWSREKGQKGG
uniref:Uncharacterized protein n=1 Tax=Bracon brevicornis TaxID=1563983 RepID=A0A6V7KWC9_9HYME